MQTRKHFDFKTNSKREFTLFCPQIVSLVALLTFMNNLIKKGVFTYDMDWQKRPSQIMDPKLSEFLDDFCRKVAKAYFSFITIHNSDTFH